MTCKVTITNESDKTSFDNHILEITGGAGDKQIIGPGQSATTNVWLEAEITIKELDVRGQRRGNPNIGYGALPPELHN